MEFGELCRVLYECVILDVNLLFVLELCWFEFWYKCLWSVGIVVFLGLSFSWCC